MATLESRSDYPRKEPLSHEWGPTWYSWLICGGAEGKFLVTKFEFGGCFVMSLKGDCHEIEVTPNLELVVTFVMSLGSLS
jgi:hypothetical protein